MYLYSMFEEPKLNFQNYDLAIVHMTNKAFESYEKSCKLSMTNTSGGSIWPVRFDTLAAMLLFIAEHTVGKLKIWP